jgi:hypothetical protein
MIYDVFIQKRHLGFILETRSAHADENSAKSLVTAS